MYLQRSAARRASLRRAALFQIEGLERRLLLSSAIAAFGAQQTFATGANPRSVAVADVNTDGKLDLLVANSVGNTVSVLLGNGNGTYQTQQTYVVGSTPFSIAAADVNLDGKLDLITANNGGNNVSVLLGNGNGTFQSQKTFGAGTNSRFVAVADINGDGKPDLITANYGAGTISVLLGNGNGTFANQETLSAGTKPSSIAVADFNVDGKLDVAVVNKGSNNVSVLLGNGNGTFQAQQLFPVGSAPFSIATGDLNQDGKLDLVTADESSNAVSVLLGNGNGTFQTHQTYATGTIPASVAIADINGDGKPDVVAANYSTNSVSVLLGNGNGSFQPQRTFATGANPFALAVADTNRDSRQDLLVANEGGNSVGTLLGDVPPRVLSINRANPAGPSTTATAVSYTVTFNEPVTGVDPTDFFLALSGVTATVPVAVSGSGAVYTVTITGISGYGTLGLNLVDDGSIEDAAGNPLQPGGQASFQPQRTFRAGVYAGSMVAADLNGDAVPDIVTTASTAGSNAVVSILLGNGDGTFRGPQTFAAVGAKGNMVVADVNADGKPDLVVTDELAGSVDVLLGNGDGTFQAARTFAAAPPTASYRAAFVTVADVNGDGKPDLVAANSSNPFSIATTTVSVMLGNGDGTFQSPQTFGAGFECSAVAVGDVNGDGKPDLVVANVGTGSMPGYSVSVLLGNGNGTFAPQQTFSAGNHPDSVAIADMNGDGKLDLVVANGSPPAGVEVLTGNGNGTFQSPKSFAANYYPATPVVTDINGDGAVDIVVADENSNTIGVLLGDGSGSLQNQQTFAVGHRPGSVATADANADGRVDLFAANGTDGTISELLAGTNASFTGQTYTIAQPPVVADMVREFPAIINDSFAPYFVDFSQPVTGIRASDFQVITTGTVTFTGSVNVGGSSPATRYDVDLSGIRGSGTIQLELVDHDDILNSANVPLGGTGQFNGSFIGQAYTILQTFPTVLSITRADPTGSTTGATTVTYNVTFSEPVTGVDPGDFSLVLNGVTATTPVDVSGSGATYSVSVSGISGNGTLGLNLVDDGSIKDGNGNPLQGLGQPSLQAQQTLLVGSDPSAIAIADLNGDGRPDLIVPATPQNPVQDVVSALLGNGNGTFQAPQTSAVGSPLVSIAVADLNGDGIPDLVGGYNFGTTMCVLLGNGNGTFRPPNVISTGWPYSRDVALADVNGDGKPDVLVAHPRYTEQSMIYGDNVTVMLGNGNGTFQAPQQLLAVGSAPRTMVGSDVNGDGIPDLLVDNYHSNSVSVLLGNGNGTFQSQRTFATNPAPKSLDVSDVNGDGQLDLVMPDCVLLGNGNGTFRTPETFIGPANTGSFSPIVATDLDGDGSPDVVISGGGFGIVGIMVGNGDGSFQPPQTFFTGPDPQSLAAGDLNGDGRPDLVTANYFSNTVSVLLNNSNGNFAGQKYTIVPLLNTVAGTSGNDTVTLVKDTDGTDIDWSIGTSGGYLPISDPNGLTINGNGGSDTITLNYGADNNNPLPNLIHLNGTFTIGGMQGSNPLANTTLEIGRSTVYISYSSFDPLSMIQGYLRNGYNDGSWNGVPTATAGVITSIPASQNAAQTTAVGYADSADGLIAGQPANTIELKYALYGDTTLTGTVGFNDFTRLTQHYNQTTGGTWDTGDFNYDGSVNFGDFTLMTRTYNTSIGNQAIPAAVFASAVSSDSIAAAPASSARNDPPTLVTSSSRGTMPLKPNGRPAPPHHRPAAKLRRKRFKGPS